MLCGTSSPRRQTLLHFSSSVSTLLSSLPRLKPGFAMRTQPPLHLPHTQDVGLNFPCSLVPPPHLPCAKKSLLVWDLIYSAKSFYANLLILFQVAKWLRPLIFWRVWHLVYHIPFLKVLPPSCVRSVFHAWHIQSSGSSLTTFSPMRCIFRAHFPPIPGLCPESSHCTDYLFQAGWLVINNRNQSSLLKQMEDSKERDLLVYEWQGKSEIQFRKEPGVKRVWTAENMTWPLVLGPNITTAAGNAGPRAPSPHHWTFGSTITSTASNH